jgi:hypothetical protein
MNGFDLSGLGPEELQQLTIHAIQMADECSQATNKLQEVIGMLVDKIQELEEGQSKLSKVVMDEIIGGVNELYSNNMKSKSIDDLKGAYGSLFDPHMDAIGEMYPGLDLWEELHKERGDSDLESFGPRVQDISAQLQAKLNKIRGTTGAELTGQTSEPDRLAREAEMTKLEGTIGPDAGSATNLNQAESELAPEEVAMATIKKMKSRGV